MKKNKNNKKLSFEELSARARPYGSRGKFAKKDPSAYQVCHRRGILDEICAHMSSGLKTGVEHPKYKHTDAELKTKASGCKTKKEFRKKYPSEYIIAHNRRIFDKITSHMVDANPAGELHSNRKYLNKEITEIAHNCKNITEFRDKHFEVYMMAYRKGMLDKICSHMPDQLGQNHPNCKYSDEEIIKTGSKYRTAGEFNTENNNLYKRAFKRKLLDNIDFVDGNYVNSSLLEIDLFDAIKAIHPKTIKLKVRKKNLIENKPHIYGFDLDIYVPELRKGIEFDGTYWHSPEALKRGRPTWPDQDILNYHEIKDNYFASKDIKILHIKEEDWVENKDDCIKRCLEFLNVKQEQKKVA